MPGVRWMANENNLIPNEQRTPSERRENARKAGLASGRARREKRTVQKILSDYLENPARSNSQLAEAAEAIGLKKKSSIKDVIVIGTLLNNLEKLKLSDLELLTKLLGESTEEDTTIEDVVAAKLNEVFENGIE